MLNGHKKTIPVKHRAVKLRIDPTAATYLRNSFFRSIDTLNTIVFNSMKREEHLKDGKYINPNVYRNNVLRENKQDVLASGVAPSCWYENAADYVIERYYGIKKRHKKKKTLDKLNLQAADGVRLQKIIQRQKDKQLNYKPIDGSKRVPLSFSSLGQAENILKYVGATFGGNLLPNDIFITRAQIPYHWQYIPNKAIGIDINMRSNVFIVVSDDEGNHIETITQTDKLQDLIYDIGTVNAQIKLAKNTKQRQRRRRKVQRLHRLQKIEVENAYIEHLLKLIVKNQAIFCVDMSLTGAKNGSYGQDKLIKALVRECENRGIPFVEVPTKWTTKMCKCGQLGERLTSETFLCSDCGPVDADIHGAYNVARFGKYIWTHGVERFKRWRERRVTSKAIGSLLPV